MKRLTLLAVLCAGSVLPASASTLYTQAPLGPGFGNGYFSGSKAKVADSFTLASAATIQSVEWYGGGGADTSFVVNIFADAAGVPGTLLDTTTVQPFRGVAFTDGGFTAYDYTADITAFSAAAGTEYWFQVLANNGDWVWSLGSGGDGQHYEDLSFYGTNPFMMSGDMAFGLSDAAAVPPVAPEPSSIVLVGTAIVGAVGSLRKRLA